MILVAFFVLLFIVFALGFLYFWGINPGDITVYLTSDTSYTVPGAIMLMAVLLVGLFIGNLVHIASAFLLSFKG